MQSFISYPFVLNPASKHVEEFVRDVNKARAIHVKTIMTRAPSEPCELSVPETARCEEVLPLFSEHKWVGVVDESGKQIGRVTAQQVINALALHTPAAMAEEQPEAAE